MSDFYQKDLFTRWLADNRHLFSYEAYIDKEGDSWFTARFKGITRHIVCRFNNAGAIEMRIDYRNEFFDIVTEFDLYEEKTPEGRYLCRICRDHPSEINPPEALEYDTREELWIKHSFEPLAAYTWDNFSDATMLCLCRYQGCTSAVIATGELLDKARQRRDFFKAVPMVEKETTQS